MEYLAKRIVPILIALAALDGFVWFEVAAGAPRTGSSLHFLNVGQGDAQLLLLQDNVAILTDAGPDKSASREIGRVFPSRHYIDIGIITHPQLDHYGGFRELLSHYRMGLLITNGREADTAKGEWRALMEKARAESIPVLALRAGDRIRYRENLITFLAPSPLYFKSNELNDTGLVAHVATPEFTALLTADIGTNVEKALIKEHAAFAADILKVGHHGSKYSSGETFLARVQPLIAAIGVGARNPYRHPTEETLARLASSTAQAVLRTDLHGTISVIPEGGKLKVYTER
jgi:beta-lactamase superfamily II metal-dependent hydrolase